MILKYKNPILEDLISGWIHAIGILLAIVGTIALVIKISLSQGVFALASIIIFGLTLILMYTTSTIYHFCRSVELKKKLRKLDHSAIYMLIAGTYTPFCLIVLADSGAWGWILLAAIWAVAVMGILLSYKKMKENASLIKTIGYICMGGMVVFAFSPLIEALSASDNMAVLDWLLIGGAFYIAGCVPYMLGKYRGMHSLWHFFVMSGSVCHYVSIWMII